MQNLDIATCTRSDLIKLYNADQAQYWDFLNKEVKEHLQQYLSSLCGYYLSYSMYGNTRSPSFYCQAYSQTIFMDYAMFDVLEIPEIKFFLGHEVGHIFTSGLKGHELEFACDKYAAGLMGYKVGVSAFMKLAAYTQVDINFSAETHPSFVDRILKLAEEKLP